MKETPFPTVMEALRNTDHAFPSRYLARFSDLNSADQAVFMKVWPNVPVTRKRTFLKSLNDLFDEDTMLLYEGMAEWVTNDPDGEVRILALKLLEETTDPHLIPGLIKTLQNDPEPDVRAEAATVLGQYIMMAEVEELNDRNKLLVETALFKAVEDANHSVARAALGALGYSSLPEVERLIESSFDRADPLWKAAALFAAGRSANPRWQEMVITGMLSEDAIERLAAVKSAGDLELKVARKPLLDMLEDEFDDDVFQAIIWSLSQIGGEDVRTYIETLLADAEDDEQIEYLEDALVNLSFTEDMEEFNLLALDADDEPAEDDK